MPHLLLKGRVTLPDIIFSLGWEPCVRLISARSPFVADVNECEVSHPCQHRCYNLMGSFICQCDQGYKLAADSVSCEGKPCVPPPRTPSNPRPSAQTHVEGVTSGSGPAVPQSHTLPHVDMENIPLRCSDVFLVLLKDFQALACFCITFQGSSAGM